MEAVNWDPKTIMAVGKRILSENNLGTIRYVGEIPPTKGKTGSVKCGSKVVLSPCRQGYGWGWNGMIQLEGSTLGSMKGSNISAAVLKTVVLL